MNEGRLTGISDSQVRVVADKQVAQISADGKAIASISFELLDHQVDNLLRRLPGRRRLLDIDSCLASDSMADADDRVDLQLKGRNSPMLFLFGPG